MAKHALHWTKHRHGGQEHSTADDYTVTHHHARKHSLAHHPRGIDGEHRHLGDFRTSSGAKRHAHRHHRKHKKFWIKQALAGHHQGALHRSLHVPLGRKIPLALERRAAKRGGRLGRRARLALTLRGLGGR